MPLSVSDFISMAKEEVDYLYSTYSYEHSSKNAAMTQWLLGVLFPSLDSDVAFELTNDCEKDSWNLTGYYKDEESATFYLLSTHFSEDPDNFVGGPGLVYALLDLISKINDDNIDSVNNQIIDNAFKAKEDGYSISVILAILGKYDPSINIANMLKTYNIPAEQLNCYDINALRRFASGLDEDADSTEIELPFMSYSTYEGKLNSLVGNVSAYALKHAFKGIVPQAYDVNLRTPLGSTKINKEMKRTLASDDKAYFWYYNNGITILCRSFELINPDTNCYKLTGPRIVNGAQTTDTIISTELEDSTEIALMVRVIPAIVDSESIMDPEQYELLQDLYLNIAKYTNSQNAIELPDFRSNEKVQKDLHDKFKTLGWFYEHRRGQWKHCDQSVYKRTSGGYKRIIMTDLAQRWFAFDGNPAVAIREKLSLFEEDGHYGKIFMHSRSAEEYLCAYIIFEEILGRLKQKISKAKEEAKGAAISGLKLSMSTQNYLMIGRATKLATAHMSAILGRGLRERYSFKDRLVMQQILALVQNGNLVSTVYSELEDTLFRVATTLQGEKYKSLHRFLSENETLDALYDIFKYVLEKELDKGRDVLALA